jgi:rhodanese-related sulfurtransferase
MQFEKPAGAQTIDEILASARSHLSRIKPEAALSQLHAADRPDSPPVLLVDIRPAAQRAQEGQIEGSLVIERNVLEWRFDPQSSARIAVVDQWGYKIRVIVMCQEGYTSSLAARALQELGLEHATDLEGGYRAWREAGLPDKI